MSGDPILSVRDLHVRFALASGEVHAVRGVDLDVQAGETVAIVGESGSGKSQTAMAAMGLLASNGKAAGRILYRGEDLLKLGPRRLDRIRGDRITMIFQEPMTSLDPLYRIGRQIAEPMIHHRGLGARAARARAIELLRLVRMPHPERRIDAYPHELSGGQRQRVMIAMALANDPDILIADEPTTALDVTIQAQILELLKDLQARLGMAIVFITHDLGIVRRFADRVCVMRAGEVVETGRVEPIFADPKAAYTKMLLAAEPTGRKNPVPPGAPILLEARNLAVSFHIPAGWFGRSAFELKAVDRVTLALRQGQTIGIVGESGSGKSTLGRALLRLMESEGTIRFEGRDLRSIDLRRNPEIRRELQIVFQDPYGSLSPRLTVGQIVTEGLLVHEPGLSRAERDRRAIAALEEVRLDPAMRDRYPHEFSGGQRQRIAIARTMILKPRVVVLDEPTSALDRSVQKEIVDLLRELQRVHDLSYLFISHDLAVVRALADDVIVMRNGRVVEHGPADDIFEHPRDGYTRALLSAAFGGWAGGEEPEMRSDVSTAMDL
ncbi:ABC transporter ATP-binding protein [Propylenella binzhouense]|uniref:ABC transporter ATP-binding protein n=1 Tax=Propylenella binzhouense TaxID=2555902 RepID=A0A964WSW1_9HYPH|nr:ABC transporter ATP-binding protein [Propylenella binzhouense]MYZ47210.1 ABC transporter ATP-binding protein [Propylenella binzhouense]